jgi:anti-sigma B factor antagonist
MLTSFDIQESTREQIVILTLSGRLTVSEAPELRVKVQALAAAGHLKVVLDLSHIDYIDSIGLGAMVGSAASLNKRGGALKLVNPNKRNAELLLMTQLNTLFEVFDGVEDAVNSFFQQRKVKYFDFFRFIKQ